MPMLERHGVRIYYEIAGDRSGAPPLLLSHGFSASARMWEPNVPALSADRQVITWDLRGHARSEAPDDPGAYTEALAIEDMLALLDTAGAERAVLGGQSLGGFLSLAFHVRHPERVAGLVLVDTGPGYRRDEARAGWNAHCEQIAAGLDRDGLAGLSTGAEVANAAHRDARGLALAARGIMAQHDATVIESLPSIRVPVLIVVGAEDAPFLAAADAMAAKIPGATKVVLDRAGHAANLDQPDEFNRAVLQLLAWV